MIVLPQRLGGVTPTVVAHHDADRIGSLAAGTGKCSGPSGCVIETSPPPIMKNPGRGADGRCRLGRRRTGAMQTKEMADAMEYDGVLPETLVILV